MTLFVAIMCGVCSVLGYAFGAVLTYYAYKEQPNEVPGIPGVYPGDVVFHKLTGEKHVILEFADGFVRVLSNETGDRLMDATTHLPTAFTKRNPNMKWVGLLGALGLATSCIVALKWAASL